MYVILDGIRHWHAWETSWKCLGTWVLLDDSFLSKTSGLKTVHKSLLGSTNPQHKSLPTFSNRVNVFFFRFFFHDNDKHNCIVYIIYTHAHISLKGTWYSLYFSRNRRSHDLRMSRPRVSWNRTQFFLYVVTSCLFFSLRWWFWSSTNSASIVVWLSESLYTIS